METNTFTDDLDLTAVRRATSLMQTAASRLTWRQAIQRRTIQVASVLRMVPGLVGRRDIHRVKTDGRWVVRVPDISEPIMAVVTRTSGRTVEDLLQPLEVQVRRPELVNLEKLRQMQRNGLIKVVFDGGGDGEEA